MSSALHNESLVMLNRVQRLFPLAGLLLLASWSLHGAGPMKDVKLVVLDPGHFHAALVQKEMYPWVSKRVSVYAPFGPDVLDYLQPHRPFQHAQGGPDYLGNGASFRPRLSRAHAPRQARKRSHHDRPQPPED